MQKTGYLKGSSYGTMLFRTIVASELKHSSAQRPCLDNLGIPRIAPHFLRGSATLSAQWFAPRHIRESMPTALNIERNSRHGKRSGLEAHLGRLADAYCSHCRTSKSSSQRCAPIDSFPPLRGCRASGCRVGRPGQPK